MRGFTITVAVEDGTDPLEIRDAIGNWIMGDPSVQWVYASEAIADLPDEPQNGALAVVKQALDFIAWEQPS